MICKVCNKVPDPHNTEDCFEKALNTLQQHYNFYKNALHQQDVELKQVNDRNKKLLKALQLLQKSQQELPPNKRFRSSQQNSDDSWFGNNSDRAASDISLTDEEPVAAPNLNMALNSEQLFDTSALSPGDNDTSIISSSEFVTSPRVKESPKRNKQHDEMLRLKDRNNKRLERTKSEWHTKERNSPTEKSWATKFLKPSTAKTTEKSVDIKKTDKRLCLSLKKTNPSKMKQSLIHFNKTKDNSNRETNNEGEDIIDASPMISTKNIKHSRSWAHR
ncbi:hypothetical protein DOY81_004432 [Sarcophaga bullata]|nr:hypothetical protein DOY81_004432 [Sarcophaga bullata]